MNQEPEFLPQGALSTGDGTVRWRVWAPFSESVHLVTWPNGNRAEIEMQPEGSGYFVHDGRDVEEGLRYAYKLSGGQERPDPASLWQPDGVHKPSAVFFADRFPWSDGNWRGIAREDLVIYELHVGTFTPEGTFQSVTGRMAELARLGITAIEVMPVSQFPGERNWGYDGVHLYAAQNSYGGPRGLQRLVDAAHQVGLAVILDVVYNHFGPEGNYLGEFGPYFTDRYHTPWGLAINYDGPDSEPVRRFMIDNATMWVRDFHIDGLRLDAVHAIYDFGANHILADIQTAVQEVAAQESRTVHVIAETNQNDVRLINTGARGGYGLDGVWSDDFHHSVHALTSGERDGYYQDFGTPEQLAKAYNDMFVYDGCYSRFRRRRVGNRVGNLDRTHFVVCLKNHDQVGNRALGDRPSSYLPPQARRLTCGLLMLSPAVPLIFMGEEYGETRPFPFFCSFGDPELIEAVRRGRRREFEDLAFDWGTDIPDPQSPETFASARLSWSWPDGSLQSGLRALYRDLLRARREWPALQDRRNTKARLVTLGSFVAHADGRAAGGHRPKGGRRLIDPAAEYPLGAPGSPEAERGNLPLLVIERGEQGALICCANLSDESQPLGFTLESGKESGKLKASESPPAQRIDSQLTSLHSQIEEKRLVLSTEDVRYGGSRQTLSRPAEILAQELLIFGGSEPAESRFVLGGG